MKALNHNRYFQVYVIPETVCKKLGKKPNYYWNIPESTVALLEEGALQLHQKKSSQEPEPQEELGDLVKPSIWHLVESPIKDVVAGDRIIVTFEESNYISVVQKRSEGMITVKFMRKRTQTTLNHESTTVKFNFPDNEDILDYVITPGEARLPKEFLVKLLPSAMDVARRGSSINVQRTIVDHFDL